MATLSELLSAGMSLKMLFMISTYRIEKHRKSYGFSLRGQGVKNRSKMKKSLKNKKVKN